VRTELSKPFGSGGESASHRADTGSGYGGKHTGECAVEAARLARASGKPVKLVWSREESLPGLTSARLVVIDIKSGLKK